MAPTPTARPSAPPAHIGRNCGRLKVSAPLLGEHVRQAGGLLPGGVGVVGLYVFGPGGLPATGPSPLLESLAAAWASGWGGGAKRRGPPTPPPPCLVVGWCADTRRLTARELSWRGSASEGERRAMDGGGAVAAVAAATAAAAAAVAGAAAPVALRFTPLVPTLILARAAFPLAACPPLPADGAADAKVASALARAAAAAGRRAGAALALVGGQPVRPGEAVGDCVGRLGLEDGGPLVVELAPPPACCLAGSEDEEEGGGAGDGSPWPSPGTVTLAGSVVALALATPRDSMASLVAALAGDVARSLAARLAAAVDAAEDAEADAAIAAAVPGGFSASAAADEAAAAGGAAPDGCCGPSGAGAPGVPSWEVTPPLLRHPAALGWTGGGALATPLGRRGLVRGASAFPGLSDLALPGDAGEEVEDAAAVVEGVAQLVMGGGGGAVEGLAVQWLEGPPAGGGSGGSVVGGGVGAPPGKRMALALDGGVAGCPVGVWAAGGAAAVVAVAVGVAWLSLL